MVVRSLIVILMALTLTGCAGSFFRPLVRGYSLVKTDGTDTLVMDAKRRAIIGIPNPNRNKKVSHKPGEVERMAFYCAEPSPDALAAISAALTVSGKADKDALKIAVTEAAKQLGRRNATIQLLRDGLYRQCEAFLNGVVDDVTYSWIANKYVNAMVVLLAIEEITPDPEPDRVEVSVDGKEKQEENDTEDSEPKATTVKILLKQPEVETAAARRSVGVSEAVADAVADMTTEYLANDALNYCLHTSRFFKSDPFFSNICKLILAQLAPKEKADIGEATPVPDEQERQQIFKEE